MRKLAEFFTKDQNNLTVSEKKKILRNKLIIERSRLAAICNSQEWGPGQFLKALEHLKISIDDLEKNKFRVACYFPIQSELSFMDYVKKNWIFPALGEKKELLWFEFGDGKTGYIKNKYNILEKERKHCFSYTPEMSPLLCFVPGLAASRAGERLGYGGGYYDRFLAGMGENIISVLCLPTDDFLFDLLPTEVYDQKVSVVIV